MPQFAPIDSTAILAIRKSVSQSPPLTPTPPIHSRSTSTGTPPSMAVHRSGPAASASPIAWLTSRSWPAAPLAAVGRRFDAAQTALVVQECTVWKRPPSIRARLDIGRPQVAVVDVLQRHGHHLGLAVDIDAAEKLQAETGGEIFALLRAAALLEHGFRPERVVEQGRRPGARMQRAGHELPERFEFLIDRTVRIIMMRGRVMHVGGQPHRVADAGAFHE